MLCIKWMYTGEIRTFLFFCLHDSAWEPQDRVWYKLYVIHTICVLINILSNKCTLWYNTHDIYKLLHVLAPKRHPQGVTAINLYKPAYQYMFCLFLCVRLLQYIRLLKYLKFMVMIIYSILMCYNIFIISCLRCQFLVAHINIGGVYTLLGSVVCTKSAWWRTHHVAYLDEIILHHMESKLMFAYTTNICQSTKNWQMRQLLTNVLVQNTSTL
jgi:hypothetical protein